MTSMVSRPRSRAIGESRRLPSRIASRCSISVLKSSARVLAMSCSSERSPSPEITASKPGLWLTRHSTKPSRPWMRQSFSCGAVTTSWITADQPLGGLEASEHQSVVTDLAILDHVEQAGHFLDLAGTDGMGEMLPDVNAVRMLAGGAAASRGVAEIAVGRAGEPGMRLEDAAPMLAGARRYGDDRSGGAGAQKIFGALRVGGEGVVVADAGEDARLAGAGEERGAALEIGAAERLLDQEGAGRRGIERGIGNSDVGVGRRADEQEVGLVAESGPRVLEENGIVPGAVATGIGG